MMTKWIASGTLTGLMTVYRKRYSTPSYILQMRVDTYNLYRLYVGHRRSNLPSTTATTLKAPAFVWYITIELLAKDLNRSWQTSKMLFATQRASSTTWIEFLFFSSLLHVNWKPIEMVNYIHSLRAYVDFQSFLYLPKSFQI